MIILGGHHYKADTKLGTCATADERLKLLDMISLQWATQYITPDPANQVPRAIVEWIGGRYSSPLGYICCYIAKLLPCSVHGNASMDRPENDFSSQGLAALFEKSLVSTGGGSNEQASEATNFHIWLFWKRAWFCIVLAVVQELY